MKILNISLDVKLNENSVEQVHTFSLAKKLVKNNIDLLLIVSGNENEFLKKDNLNIFTVKLSKVNNKINILFKVLHLIKKNINIINILRKNVNIYNYDIIYERYNLVLFGGLVISKLYKKNFIYELNGIPDEEFIKDLNIKNKILKKIIFHISKLQINNAKSVIVQTNELKTIIQKRYNVNNINIVPNGVNLYQENKNNISNKRILFAGTLDDNHNLDDVLSTFSKINYDFELIIIGDGNKKNSYINKYKQDKRFIFLGRINNNKVLNFIKTCNFCIASYNINNPLFKKYGFYFCPLKILEYSILNKPTIIYGMNNSFLDKFLKNEAVFIVSNKTDFANKVLILLNNNVLTYKMGINAYDIAKKFSWEEAAKKTIDIINKSKKNDK